MATNKKYNQSTKLGNTAYNMIKAMASTITIRPVVFSLIIHSTLVKFIMFFGLLKYLSKGVHTSFSDWATPRRKRKEKIKKEILAY
jgi:hypothetical protein